MADTTIINEQERTGVLPFEEMMAKASASVATPAPSAGSGVDMSGFEPAGNAPGPVVSGPATNHSDATPGMSLIEDILSAFYTTPNKAQGQNAVQQPRSSSPFRQVTRSLAPFTVMSPQVDISDFIAPKGMKPGYHSLTAQQWVAGKSGGKKKAHAGGGKISLFNTYKGGLDDIRGASMPGMRVMPQGDIRVTMGMLDPKLVMALQKEREKQLAPTIAPDAKALTNEDFRQLMQHNNQAHRKKLGI